MNIIDNSDDGFFSSADWLRFQELFPQTGRAKLSKKNHSAIIDGNFRRIFGLGKAKTDTEDFSSVSVAEVLGLVDTLKRSPNENDGESFHFPCKDGDKWIKLFVSDKEKDTLIFFTDITAELNRRSEGSCLEYDTITHFITSNVFIKRVEALLSERGEQQACMAVLNIKNIEGSVGYSHSDRLLASVAKVLMPFSSDSIIIGNRNFKGFLVFIIGMNKQQTLQKLMEMNDAVAGCKIIDSLGTPIPECEGVKLCLNIGYSWYPEQAKSIDELMIFSDFASYETRMADGMMKEFLPDEYEKEKKSFAEAQCFTKIIDKNMVNYHFQPIVSAKTGEIYAYEALMRPVSDTPISPLQLISMAERHNRLYEIEKITFHNTLDYLSKNQQCFEKKKLFINSITSCILTDREFADMMSTYGELFEKVVIEITEQADLSDEALSAIKDRYSASGSEIAIDDYGTGYSNTANLLRCLPNYVKIDRALITDVDKDKKKQHFVSNIIKFCKANDILVLAEGIENDGELRWLVREGVDLLQGYYTSKPKPVLVNEISREVRDTIIKTSLEQPSDQEESRFEINEPTKVDLMTLALAKYTEIYIAASETVINGEKDKTANLSIITADNLIAKITIRDINVRGIWRPSIVIGENCSIELVVEENCKLSYEGIKVSDSSRLTITGKGSLRIDADRNNGIGIGADFESSYGGITLDCGGLVEVYSNGDHGICVGGGHNLFGSDISITSGEVRLVATGPEAIALGSMHGNGFVSTAVGTSLRIRSSGDSAVGIGSFDNKVKIDCRGELDVCTTGQKAVCIGSLYKGSGYIDISESNGMLLLKAQSGAVVGSINGTMETVIKHSKLNIRSQGETIAAIGDCVGNGLIKIADSGISVNQLAGKHSVEIGTRQGTVQVVGGKVNAEIYGKVEAI